jgi:phosphopantothenoylcysteine decarboxylase/phosphopantothenate--cysteine ligase
VTQRVLLIIGGGIAAYKSLDLIRRLRERGANVRVVLTRAAQEFVTPLAAGALSNDRVFTDLFDLDDEREIGHIRLARDTDLIIVAPATADLLAKMATGQANDLATAVLLATDKPVLAAPAMNPRMWSHPATRRNVRQLEADGIAFIGPKAGEMAERGEAGVGRMAEPIEIADTATQRLTGQPSSKTGLLASRHVLVTSGPTHEPIDPVRYIANRSSGKQGHAIAAAAAAAGARVTLVSGPVTLADPPGVTVVKIQTAAEMLSAVEAALPADVAIFAAAVADWRVAAAAGQKMKKTKGSAAPTLALTENPDILKVIAARGPRRPALVIGFAAETESVVAHAQKKRKDKAADWIVANDVSPATGTFGGDWNTVHLVTAEGVTSWPPQSKDEVARLLIEQAAGWLAAHQTEV